MRETEILVEQTPPQGVLVCDHAGLVINKFSFGTGSDPSEPDKSDEGSESEQPVLFLLGGEKALAGECLRGQA